MCNHKLNLPPLTHDLKEGDRAQCERCGEWFERFAKDDGSRGYWAWRSLVTSSLGDTHG